PAAGLGRAAATYFHLLDAFRNADVTIRRQIRQFLDQAAGPGDGEALHFFSLGQAKLDIGGKLRLERVLGIKFAHQLLGANLRYDSSADAEPVALYSAQADLQPMSFGKAVLKKQQRAAPGLSNDEIFL